jgi:hypothetical protein
MWEVPFVRKADDLALATNHTNHLAQSSSRFARHRRASRVVHLEPVGRAAGTVGRVLALRHDAFESELAGMPENKLAIFVFNVLVQP